MLTIIFGLVFMIAGVLLTVNFINAWFMLLFLLGAIVVTIAINIPLQGMKKATTVCEYELVPLIPDTNVYIIVDNTNTTMCRYKKDGKEIIKSLSGKYVIYREIEENKTPKLKKKVLKPKRGLWAVPLPFGEDCNILYVPKNSVIE